MKTLIIHPDDRSTDFLRPIYQNIKGATVLTKNISGKQLEKEIQSHDQILMMGHGSPSGLFSMSKIGEGTFIVGEKQVPLLRDKHCIFIWCNADQFVSRHRLKGLYTGMFISEVGEANYCKVPADQETVDVSNSRFADLLGGVLTEGKADYSKVFEHVKTFYGKLATINEIADQIVEEKTNQLKKQILSLIKFKEEKTSEIEILNQRLSRIDQLHIKQRLNIIKEII